MVTIAQAIAVIILTGPYASKTPNPTIIRTADIQMMTPMESGMCSLHLASSLDFVVQGSCASLAEKIGYELPHLKASKP